MEITVKDDCKSFTEIFSNGVIKATVTINVNFDLPVTKNYLTTEIKSSDPNLNGATSRCSNHRDITDAYPLKEIGTWKNLKGQTIIDWVTELCDEGHLIPTARERNRGISDEELFRRRQREM